MRLLLLLCTICGCVSLPTERRLSEDQLHRVIATPMHPKAATGTRTMDLYRNGRYWGILAWPYRRTHEADDYRFQNVTLSTNVTYTFEYMYGYLNPDQTNVPQVSAGGLFVTQLLRISVGDQVIWQSPGWRPVTTGAGAVRAPTRQ